MSDPILITAAKEDSEEILSLLSDYTVCHAPLEVYKPRSEDASIGSTLNSLDDFENIVYSSKRNARFFLDQVQQFDKIEAVQNRVNLALDADTFEFLEAHHIPAIHPQNGEEPIDLVELMLRLQRFGNTLYPTGSHQREDFPGFLEELDISVKELDVFDLKGPSNDALEKLKQKVEEEKPKTVVFHSRRSVNRTLAAFPELDYANLHIISADKGISNKLQQKDISVDDEAEGSWESIAELV